MWRISLILTISLSAAGRFINPVTDPCWECIFPITLSGINVTPNHNEQTSSKRPICVCTGTPPKVGIPLTFWEPLYLVDVTRHAYKLVGMGGISVGKESVKNRGSVGIVGEGPSETSFYHVHWYKFPIMALLGLFEDFVCVEQGQLDIPYMSELDPLWGDDRLSFIMNPEAALFSTPAAQTACLADCLLSSRGKNSDAFFWCAGCQGSLYPFTGTVPHHSGSLQATSLLVHRLLAKMHRVGALKGFEKGEFCSSKFMPLIKKSLYKTQLVYPVPQNSCNPLGKSDQFWKKGRPIPTEDESFVYLIWTKKHCCLDATKFITAGASS